MRRVCQMKDEQASGEVYWTMPQKQEISGGECMAAPLTPSFILKILKILDDPKSALALRFRAEWHTNMG